MGNLSKVGAKKGSREGEERENALRGSNVFSREMLEEAGNENG